MPEWFQPQVLTLPQQAEIAREALGQSELAVLNARNAYLRAMAAHQALVADLAGPPDPEAAPESPSAPAAP